MPLADPNLQITSEALTVDGHFVVALGSGSATRIFYGIASHLVEGTVTSTKPGCAYEIDFDVEGRSYVATLSPDAVRCMVSSKLVSGDPDGPSAVVLLSVVLVDGSPVVGGGAGDAGDAGSATDGGDAGAAVSPESLTFYCL